MRNAYLCTHNTCAHMRVMKYTDYREVQYIEDIATRLWTAFNASVISDRRKHVYTIQTGSWDLSTRDFRTTLNESLSEFRRILKEFISAISVNPGHRVLVLGTPSLPNMSFHPLKTVSRNNEVSAVYNR